MQVDGDDMVDAGDAQQIREHARGDGAAVALLLRLARVGEVSLDVSAARLTRDDGTPTA